MTDTSTPSTSTTSGASTTNGGSAKSGNAAAAAVAAPADTSVAPSQTDVTAADAPEQEEGKLWTEPVTQPVSDTQNEDVLAAEQANREDEALRIANPSQVVYRAPDPDGKIGGQSMTVGDVPTTKD